MEKLVSVKFKGFGIDDYKSAEYTYRAGEFKLAEGDIVTVGTVNGPAIAKVTNIEVYDYPEGYSVLAGVPGKKQLATVINIIETEETRKEQAKAKFEARVAAEERAIVYNRALDLTDYIGSSI